MESLERTLLNNLRPPKFSPLRDGVHTTPKIKECVVHNTRDSWATEISRVLVENGVDLAAFCRDPRFDDIFEVNGDGNLSLISDPTTTHIPLEDIVNVARRQLALH